MLAVLAALVLGLGGAVMISAMADIGGKPRCDDAAAVATATPEDNGQVECFDASPTQRLVTLALGYLGGALAALAALLALLFAFIGQRGRLLLQATAAALVVSGLGILIGSL
jgi:hypothetical protein